MTEVSKKKMVYNPRFGKDSWVEISGQLERLTEKEIKIKQLVEALEWVNKKANQTGGNGWYGCTSTRSKMISITDKALSTIPDRKRYELEREYLNTKYAFEALPFDAKATTRREHKEELDKAWLNLKAHREKVKNA